MQIKLYKWVLFLSIGIVLFFILKNASLIFNWGDTCFFDSVGYNFDPFFLWLENNYGMFHPINIMTLPYAKLLKVFFWFGFDFYQLNATYFCIVLLLAFGVFYFFVSTFLDLSSRSCLFLAILMMLNPMLYYYITIGYTATLYGFLIGLGALCLFFKYMKADKINNRIVAKIALLSVLVISAGPYLLNYIVIFLVYFFTSFFFASIPRTQLILRVLYLAIPVVLINTYFWLPQLYNVLNGDSHGIIAQIYHGSTAQDVLASTKGKTTFIDAFLFQYNFLKGDSLYGVIFSNNLVLFSLLMLPVFYWIASLFIVIEREQNYKIELLSLWISVFVLLALSTGITTSSVFKIAFSYLFDGFSFFQIMRNPTRGYMILFILIMFFVFYVHYKLEKGTVFKKLSLLFIVLISMAHIYVDGVLVNEKLKGFEIPSDYKQVRELELSKELDAYTMLFPFTNWYQKYNWFEAYDMEDILISYTGKPVVSNSPGRRTTTMDEYIYRMVEADKNFALSKTLGFYNINNAINHKDFTTAKALDGLQLNLAYDGEFLSYYQINEEHFYPRIYISDKFLVFR